MQKNKKNIQGPFSPTVSCIIYSKIKFLNISSKKKNENTTSNTNSSTIERKNRILFVIEQDTDFRKSALLYKAKN
jgi:hypothetical protein